MADLEAAYPELPRNAFAKADTSPDLAFYVQPRLVEHIDPAAVAAVTKLYQEFVPAGGTVLDLMSSWISHLPNTEYVEVVGHGMNAEELAANPRLDRWFVQDLNANPMLPLDADAFDAALMCVAVQYVQRPAEVFAELARVLRPGAPLVVTFSNRCFPTKAVAIWQALSGPDQTRLVELYLKRAGFVDTERREVLSGRRGDPLWAVVGRAP